MSPKTPSPEISLEGRSTDGRKLFSTSAARNAGPIRDVLVPLLPACANVLEIGSGTGEHAEAVCRARPDVRWQPSDPDDVSRDSLAARSEELAPALRAPVATDASAAGWFNDFEPLDAIVCCNVIHISPWSVTLGLAAGAAQLLKPNGFIFLYGPYLEGEASAPSNLAFDENLRARNPDWGVRPLDAVTATFAQHRLRLAERIAMPANNLSLVFRRIAE
jgi:SAM-dependent methyltransferase